jgi:hypothetical protein
MMEPREKMPVKRSNRENKASSRQVENHVMVTVVR